ncbi:gephyrin-like molybdotransferase receptor GlpR [Corynebacterium lizhenjunii]|uniref:divisome protein SepX/GlpR n=1 Tax=Corynebacterium lizhenjunii TaxID=2709394 RepID=UPI00198130A1|nr:gephyrin-like molybdotransferase receptor GlpR [Corynebacterium lizhenjunii]
MSTGAIIILIIVVWLFVLAPWLLRGQKPVNHTGEGFDDTRVLFNGNSGPLAGARRPRLKARPVVDSVEDEEAEEVTAELADAPSASTPAAPATIEGELVEDTVHSNPTGATDAVGAIEVVNTANAADTAVVAGAVDEFDGDDDDDVLLAEEPAAEEQAEEEAAEVFTAPTATDNEDAYPLEESYTSPVDLLYPGAVDSQEETDGQEGADGDAPAAKDAGNSTAADPAAAQEDLSDEDMEFARRRLGRGGWDPEADSAARVTRYQRRQRILTVLAVLVIGTVALGIVFGGWTWWLAAVVGVATTAYLVALRNQTLAEQRLRERRVRALRRARLGVVNAENEELSVPRSLRRPGAVVLEADDESPDFEFLAVYDSSYDAEHLGAPRIINRRSPRDELSRRRVG